MRLDHRTRSASVVLAADVFHFFIKPVRISCESRGKLGTSLRDNKSKAMNTIYRKTYFPGITYQRSDAACLTSQTRSLAWKNSSSDEHSFGKNAISHTEACTSRRTQAGRHRQDQTCVGRMAWVSVNTNVLYVGRERGADRIHSTPRSTMFILATSAIAAMAASLSVVNSLPQILLF